MPRRCKRKEELAVLSPDPGCWLCHKSRTPEGAGPARETYRLTGPEKSTSCPRGYIIMDREELEFEVVIVGAGPAGLAAALELSRSINPELICVLDKAGRVGGHILSGAVIDAIGLDRLVPEWRDEAADLLVPVSGDEFFVLQENRATRLPLALMPDFMSNTGCFVGSLGRVCEYLGEKAEQQGVEVLAGFSASELLFDDNGAVCGVLTSDTGRLEDGSEGPDFMAGVALMAKYVVLAEGARGSLSQQAIKHFRLDRASQTQKYGLGIKEIWQVGEENHRPGLVQHFIGWPLDRKTGGGGFVYHMADRMVALGHIVHLDYKNPFLDPFREMQKFKTHPMLRRLLAGGSRTGFGARTIALGGYQSVPQLTFAGGVLAGDSAGFVNAARVKGSHNAILSGMLAARHVAGAIGQGRRNDRIEGLEDAWKGSAIGKDLGPVRNIKPLWSKLGRNGAMAVGGLDMWGARIFGRPLLGTLRQGPDDATATEPAHKHTPPAYPEADGKLVFDKPSSLFVSGVSHRENQPVHLKIENERLQTESALDEFAGPCQNYCPAGVYEWKKKDDTARLLIHAQNCLHCKTCDIKDPNANIIWTVPEGGGGPDYSNM